MKSLNPRQQRFAGEISLGKSVSAAALAAGYSKSYSRKGAFRLAQHPAVIAAAEEARNAIREETKMTAERLAAKLETALIQATEAKQMTAAASILGLIGKLHGLLIDRSHVIEERINLAGALAEALARARISRSDQARIIDVSPVAVLDELPAPRAA